MVLSIAYSVVKPKSILETAVFLFGLALIPVSRICDVAVPLIASMALDRLLTGDASFLISLSCLAQVVAAATKTLGDSTLDALCEIYKIRAQIKGMEHAHGLSFSYLQMIQVGQLIDRIQKGAEGLPNFVRCLCIGIAPIIIQILLTFSVFANFGAASITGVLLVAALLYVVATGYGGAKLGPLYHQYNLAEVGFAGLMVQSLSNYETVRVFAAERRDIERSKEYGMKNIMGVAVKLARLCVSLDILKHTLQQVGMLTSLLIAANFVSTGEFTAGNYVMVQMYIMQLFNPLTILSFQVNGAIGSFNEIK